VTDYTLIVAIGCVIAVASYGLVGQLLKPMLRLWARMKARKAGRKLYPEEVELFKIMTQSGAVVSGGLMGAGPIWPEMIPWAMGPLLGLAFGSLAIPLHSAVKKALPEKVASVISGKSPRKLDL